MGGLEHRRRDHADLAVKPLVVEPVDVGERRPLDVLGTLPGTLVIDQLGLVETVEALGEGVVIGVTLAANRRLDARVDQSMW